MKCDHCDSRLDDNQFRYDEWTFCCGCMSALCSWFLDGGWITDPEMFGYVTTLSNVLERLYGKEQPK